MLISKYWIFGDRKLDSLAGGLIWCIQIFCSSFSSGDTAILLFRGIPGNRGDGIFYKSRYCEDRDNRGPGKRGLTVCTLCIYT